MNQRNKCDRQSQLSSGLVRCPRMIALKPVHVSITIAHGDSADDMYEGVGTNATEDTTRIQQPQSQHARRQSQRKYQATH